MENLDAMATEELRAMAADTHGLRPLRAARTLFPSRHTGYVNATRDIHNYCWNLITARACRERGDIDTALMYEGICDRIYAQLPEYARW